MRIFLIAVLLLPGLVFAEVFRWTDSNGVVHFSDRPSGNQVEPAELPSLIVAEPAQPMTAVDSRQDSASQAAPISMQLLQPAPGATLREGVGVVEVEVKLGRELAPEEALRYLLDGEARIQQSRQTRVQFMDVTRGGHQIQVVLMRAGKRVAATQSVTVYVKRPGAISPSGASTGPSTAVPTAPAVNQVGGVQ